MRPIILAAAAAAALVAQQPSTREMNDLNWMEFRQLVPARIQTVLLPTGTVEAHGVINNGADNTAPTVLSQRMAQRLNALVAPPLNYGVTGSLDGYAGTFQVSETSYRGIVSDILTGLARNKFRNIIIVNGHGGPQSAILSETAEKVGRAERVRVMVTNWWSICSDITLKTFGEDGGHAGWNETAFIQAIDPRLVRQELYSDNLAIPRPAAGTWTAFPFPAPIILYQPGQGYVKFDQAKAEAYFSAVLDRMVTLIRDTITAWDRGHLFE